MEEVYIMSEKPTKEEPEVFVSQKDSSFRSRFPEWLKQFPYLRFPDAKDSFQLIDPKDLEEVLAGASPEATARIKEDIEFLDYELLRLFRQKDYRASYEQNRYRKYQIGYMFLAAMAGLIGALQALSLSGSPELAAVFAFMETVVAAFVTFLSTVKGESPPLDTWLTNRRRAEFLRREYFRYLLNLEPYDDMKGYHRQRLLSARAADINRGNFPNKVIVTQGGNSEPA